MGFVLCLLPELLCTLVRWLGWLLPSIIYSLLARSPDGVASLKANFIFIVPSLLPSSHAVPWFDTGGE